VYCLDSFIHNTVTAYRSLIDAMVDRSARMQPVVNYCTGKYVFLCAPHKTTPQWVTGASREHGTSGGAKVRTVVQKRPLSLIHRTYRSRKAIITHTVVFNSCMVSAHHRVPAPPTHPVRLSQAVYCYSANHTIRVLYVTVISHI
jgi:hypothetical protein